MTTRPRILKILLIGILMAGMTVPLITPAKADNSNQVIGTLLGAGLGGLIGNQFGSGGGKTVATVGGVVLGGIAGNSIGASMDQRERTYYGSRPAYSAGYAYPQTYSTTYVPNYVAPRAPEPQSIAYYNETGGTYCREYTQEVHIDGQVHESYGTACLQPDGSWRVVR